MLVRMQRKGNPRSLLVGMWIGAAIVENSIEAHQKTKDKEFPGDLVFRILAFTAVVQVPPRSGNWDPASHEAWPKKNHNKLKK